jgi:hypothetical protein
LVAGSRSQIKVDDVLFALRDQPRLHDRGEELLEAKKRVDKHSNVGKQKTEKLLNYGKEKKKQRTR